MPSANTEASATLSTETSAAIEIFEKEEATAKVDEDGSAGCGTTVKIELRALGAVMWDLNWLCVLAGAAGMSRLQLLAAGLAGTVLKRCNTEAEATQAESSVQQLRQQALSLVQIKLACSILLGVAVANVCSIADAPQVIVVTMGVLGMVRHLAQQLSTFSPACMSACLEVPLGFFLHLRNDCSLFCIAQLFNLIGVPTGVRAVIFRPHWCLILIWIAAMKAANTSEASDEGGPTSNPVGEPWPLTDWKIPVLVSTLILVQAYVSNALEPTLYRGYFMELSDGDANEGSYDSAPVPRTSVTTMVQSVETVDALQNEVRYQLGWRWPSLSGQNDLALANAEAGETAGIDHQIVRRILLVAEGKRAGQVLEQGTLAECGISLDSTPVIIVCELPPPPSRVSSSEELSME